jgi:hypothetical protein
VIPIGPIVAVALMAAMNARRGEGGAPRRPEDGGGAGPISVLLWLVAFVWLPVRIGSITSDALLAPAAFAVDAALILLLFPWPVARLTTIPLGWVRASWVLGWLAAARFRVDRRGGAALAAAWALCRRRRGDAAAKAAAFVERRLAALAPLRGAGIAAAGLARAAAGDREGARSLLESVLLLDERVVPATARRLAREWLVVDAVATGDWARAVELGGALGPRTATTAFLVVAARRLHRDGSARPSRLALVARWLLARERLESLPLLRRAWRASASSAPPADRVPQIPSTPPEAGPLAEALALHVALVGAASDGAAAIEVPDEALVRLGRAWERALEDATTRRRAAERALALGASAGGATALDRVAATVEDDLVAWAVARRRPLPSDAGRLVARAESRLRDRLLSEIELASTAIRDRAAARRALPILDEWREWLALRALVERAVALGGPSLRRVAYTRVHPDAGKLAVWLWNQRTERAVANAIFRWLLDEAVAVGDEEAMSLEGDNVRCGPF